MEKWRIGVLCVNKADMPRGEPDFPYEGPIGDHEELGVFVSVPTCVRCARCSRAVEVKHLPKQKP